MTKIDAALSPTFTIHQLGSLRQVDVPLFSSVSPNFTGGQPACGIGKKKKKNSTIRLSVKGKASACCREWC